MLFVFVQWLHEENLILPDSHYPWVGPQRSMLLTSIKKVCRQHIRWREGGGGGGREVSYIFISSERGEGDVICAACDGHLDR